MGVNRIGKDRCSSCANRFPHKPHVIHGLLPTELQREETNTVLDEPVANRHFETIEELDAVVARRCLTLDANPELFKGRIDFHWWPKTIYLN